MSTTLTTPSNTLAKMRFQEQYVSEGLNKKLNGVVPAGVIRGGDLVTNASGLEVRLDADPDTGDSIYSYIDANGHQLTFRQVGNIVVDLASVASTTVYLALFVDYTTSVATVIEWRAYTEAEIVTAPVAEAPYLVIVGRVVVPAVGPIVASEIDPAQRRDAGLVPSARMREWEQVVVNGDFEMAPASPAGGFLNNRIHAWEDAFNDSGGAFTAHTSTASPFVGTNELEIRSDGVAAMVVNSTISQDLIIPVNASTLLKGHVAVRGSSMPVGGASSYYGISILFYDVNLNLVGSAIDIAGGDNTLSGSFAYTEFEGIVEVPTGALWAKLAIRVTTDGVTPALGNALFFDNIRLWVRRDTFDQDGFRRDIGVPLNRSLSGNRMLLSPPVSSLIGDVDDFVSQTLERSNVASLPVVAAEEMQFLTEALRGNPSVLAGVDIGSYVLRLIGGNREFIKALDRDSERVTANSRVYSYGTTGDKDLLYALDFNVFAGAVNEGVLRIYQANESHGFVESPGYEIVYNAAWDPTANDWTRDANMASWKILLNREGIKFWSIATPANATPWASGAWDHATSDPMLNFLVTNSRFTVSGAAGDAAYVAVGDNVEDIAETVGAFPPIKLMQQTVVKAWGFITIDASGVFGTINGYNWTAVRTGNVIDVSFVDALDNANYSLSGALMGGQSEFVSFSAIATGGFTINLFSDAGAVVALSSGNARTFAFMCFGELT